MTAFPEGRNSWTGNVAILFIITRLATSPPEEKPSPSESWTGEKDKVSGALSMPVEVPSNTNAERCTTPEFLCPVQEQ
jgi:hypothetical protein